MKNFLRISAFGLGILVSAWTAVGQTKYAGKNGWYKGNSHIHTNRVSGGELTPTAAAKWYHDNDYDFIVLTEHRVFLGNTDVTFSPRRPDFMVVSGEEFNSLTGYGNNHTTVINATGALGDITGGSTSKWEFFNKVYDLAKSKGAYPFMNHPNWASVVSTDDFLKINGFRHFELFNGSTDTDNFGMYGTGVPAIEPIWDSVLTRGGKFYGVGSDDMHQFTTRPETSNPMTGWTMLKADNLTLPAILDAYEHGRFYATGGIILKDLSTNLGLYKISIDTAATLAELARRDVAKFANPARPVSAGTPGFKIEYIGPNGKILKTVLGDSAEYQVTLANAYVRARVTYLRPITSNGAPYDNVLKRADYIKSKNLTKEEYYAWGQPYFTDTRREGPALVFGCTNPGYLEFDPKANVSDTTQCLNKSVSILSHVISSGSGRRGLTIVVAPDFGIYTIEILTVKGRLIKKVPSNLSRTHTISGLAAFGTYLVKIRSNKKVITKRIRMD